MIRIKVFSLKELLHKVLFFIMIIIVFFIILYISSELIKNIKIDNSIIESAFYVFEDERTSIDKGRSMIKSGIILSKIISEEDYKEEIEQLESEEESGTKISHIESRYTEKIRDGRYRVGNTYINSYLKDDVPIDKLVEPSIYNLSNQTKILLYHTHTSESYTTDMKNKYEYSDYYRTENDLYNVVGVANIFAEKCRSFGMEVDHDITKHDYPSYSGAYKASLNTVERRMQNKKYDIIFDIHRDALSGNATFRPVTKINDQEVAKLMFVVGTDASGLKHDNWIKNLKFALAVQEKANEVYPGLFRDIHLSTSRYNQHVSDKALIIEVGATGNTLEEASLAIGYLSEILESMIVQ